MIEEAFEYKNNGYKISSLLVGIFCLIIGVLLFSGYNGIVITGDGIRATNSSDFQVIYVIKGKIRQNINASYTGIMPTFNLLDKNGNIVRQTAGLIVSNYEGNNIWSFTVEGNDADRIVKSFELNSCYGL